MNGEMMEYKDAGAGYATYQSMVSTVNTALSDLEKICTELKLEESRKDLEQIRERLSNHTFAVGVMGEFKRGKSTVINSLLEKEIMPSDILPCSATMNRVTYGLHPHVQLKMLDGSVRDIPVEELADYVTKLTAENESRAAEVDEAIVYYPCRFCQNGVDIVDTPGLNDDDRMNRISEEVIPILDAVIMVLTPDNPFSMSEAEFVRTKLMSSDLSRLIFVVNKIDQVRRKSDRERVIESIREKILKSVMGKIAEVYGEDSLEYKDAKQKMANVRVFPLSALDALDGKMTGDHELIMESGTLAFEDALTRMLTEERGALELGAPLSAIARITAEVAKAITVRKNALALSAQEFEQCQNEALEQMQQMRQRKQEEKRRLKDEAIASKMALANMVSEFYPKLRQGLYASVDEAAGQIDAATLTDEAGQKTAAEKMQKLVSKQMEGEMSVFAEKLQVKMNGIIGEEALKASRFVGDLSNQISALQMNIGTKNKFMDTGDIVSTGIETFAVLGGATFCGIGGIVSGYRSAGVKGALVGGGVSMAAAWAAAFLVPVSIGVLPALLICSAVGTISGKYITRRIFGKDIGQKKLDEIKKTMRESIDKMIDEMQMRRELEKWAENLTEERFDQLIDGMDSECERLLKDTAASMDQIKQSLTENEMQRRQTETDCEETMEEIKRITAVLNPIGEDVRRVLERA